MEELKTGANPSTPVKTYGLATASLILGIAGFILCIGIPSLLAVIFGIIGLVRIGKSAGALTGKGQAIAGIILGGLWLVLFPILVILLAIIIPSNSFIYDLVNKKSASQTDSPSIPSDSARYDETVPADIDALDGFTFIETNSAGYKEYRHKQTGMVFVLLPAGSFQMGSNDADEKPIHEVTLNSFLIAKYEVTQSQWQKIMWNNPSRFKGDNNPVEKVSWDDCREFCKKTGLRLPTEAEWEYAARAGTNTLFYWGDEEGGDYMWYSGNSEDTTHPVGEKKPNGFGLYDMSGNIWEWCSDWYGDNYYGSSPKNNPQGLASGQYRVLRGGAWCRNAYLCRLSYRIREVPSVRDTSYFGFRCVQNFK